MIITFASGDLCFYTLNRFKRRNFKIKRLPFKIGNYHLNRFTKSNGTKQIKDLSNSRTMKW